MGAQRRRIVIRLVSRGLKDSSDLIKVVADTFPADDIEIDASKQEGSRRVEIPLDNEVVQSVQNALDQKDLAYKQGSIEAPSKESASGKILAIARKLFEEGGKLTARVLATEAIKDQLGKAVERFKDLT